MTRLRAGLKAADSWGNRTADALGARFFQGVFVGIGTCIAIAAVVAVRGLP